MYLHLVLYTTPIIILKQNIYCFLNTLLSMWMHVENLLRYLPIVLYVPTVTVSNREDVPFTKIKNDRINH